jgi:hypothetical protein
MYNTRLITVKAARSRIIVYIGRCATEYVTERAGSTLVILNDGFDFLVVFANYFVHRWTVTHLIANAPTLPWLRSRRESRRSASKVQPIGNSLAKVKQPGSSLTQSVLVHELLSPVSLPRI